MFLGFGLMSSKTIEYQFNLKLVFFPYLSAVLLPVAKSHFLPKLRKTDYCMFPAFSMCMLDLMCKLITKLTLILSYFIICCLPKALLLFFHQPLIIEFRFYKIVLQHSQKYFLRWLILC